MSGDSSSVHNKMGEQKKNKRRKIKEEEETNEKEKKWIKIVSSTRLGNATRLNSPPQVENITDGGKKHGQKNWKLQENLSQHKRWGNRHRKFPFIFTMFQWRSDNYTLDARTRRRLLVIFLGILSRGGIYTISLHQQQIPNKWTVCPRDMVKDTPEFTRFSLVLFFFLSL